MSEAELHVIKKHLVEAVRSKARRGEFRRRLPTGYIWDQAGRTQITPNDEVVQAIRLVFDRFDQLEGIYIPDGVGVQVTRNYGATADSKAKKLITKLAFATGSVILLVLLAIGWRESVIVGAADDYTPFELAQAVEQGEIPELAGYSEVRREVRVGRSRLDLVLGPSPRCNVEIKNGNRLFYDGLAQRKVLQHLAFAVRIAAIIRIRFFGTIGLG